MSTHVTLVAKSSMHSLVPGRSHIQSLIACSIQIRRGKAWETWSHVVSGKFPRSSPGSRLVVGTAWK